MVTIPPEWRARLGTGAAVVAALCVAFAFGRFSAAAPEVHTRDEAELKVVQQVWSGWMFKQVTDTKRDSTTRREFRPDGTVASEQVEEHEATHVVASGSAFGGSSTEAEATHVATKDVVPHQPDWRVGALVGAQLSFAPLGASLAVGAHAERRILGPLSAGVWALYTPSTTGLAAGVSLSLEF